MNVENFNEKYDRYYVEDAVGRYKYDKFKNWFNVLKDIFSYTHNAIYSGGKEFHIIFSNKHDNSKKIKITVTNRFNDLLVTADITDQNFISCLPWFLNNEIFYSLDEVYYFLMDVFVAISNYSNFTPLELPKMSDEKKKEANYLRATSYIASIKYHYKEV